MKKIIIYFSLFLFLFSTKVFACDCGIYDLKQIDGRSYKYSDLIIIGNVIKTGENYKIKIIEILKGNCTKRTIKGTITNEKGYTNSCFTTPRTKGKYIFYLNEIKNRKGYYSYSSCSGSRPLDMSIYPISLESNKSKSELISETNNWIDSLRLKKTKFQNNS